MGSNENGITEVVANTIFELKERFGETRITAETIHIVVKEVIELVENFSCTGAEKKEYVITIVKALVNDLVDNDEEKRIILEMIEKKILENTIDLIILATKGELNINNKKTQKKVILCCKSFIPILIDTVMHFLNSLNKNNSKKETKVEGEHTILASEVQIEENEKPQGALEQAPAPAA